MHELRIPLDAEARAAPYRRGYLGPVPQVLGDRDPSREALLNLAVDPLQEAPAPLESIAVVTAQAVVLADATEISLVQTVLKLTVPGRARHHHGAELWEQSLVDPDNRRPVDFQRRADLLVTPLLSVAATDPFAKFEITRRLLKLRQSNPPLFAEGSYQPLAVDGPEAEAVCAFARLHGDAGLVVAVPLGARGRAGAQVRIALPRGSRRFWSPVLTDAVTVRDSVASFDRSLLVVMHTDDRLQRM